MRDKSYRKLDKFTFHVSDAKSSSKFFKLMREKYGFEPEIKAQDAPNGDSLLKDQKDLFDMWQ